MKSSILLRKNLGSFQFKSIDIFYTFNFSPFNLVKRSNKHNKYWTKMIKDKGIKLRSDWDSINVENADDAVIIPLDGDWTVHLGVPWGESSHIETVTAFGHKDTVGDVLEVFVGVGQFGDDLDFEKKLLQCILYQLIIWRKWDHRLGCRWLREWFYQLTCRRIPSGCWRLSGWLRSCLLMCIYFGLDFDFKAINKWMKIGLNVIDLSWIQKVIYWKEKWNLIDSRE